MNVVLTLVLAALVHQTEAFWRLSCGRIQTGRIDPIINPGAIAGHAHIVSGPNNFNTTSTFQSYQSSLCTSCSIQDDKSAYWTPQLYYRFRNGTYVDVPTGGTVVYYLSRGDDNLNMVPFPEGYKVLAGDAAARSFNFAAKTYKNSRYIAERTSFACLNYDKPSPDTPRITNMDCPGGLRAQIHFPSCWDGVNLYKSDQSHVTYLSGIDTGQCPPTHPKTFPHIFFEVIYSVNNIQKQPGGYFVFSNGDATGYGFHGDFQNGWKTSVMKDAIQQCMGDNRAINQGSIQLCPPLNASYDDQAVKNCPEQKPLVKEKARGLLKALPGCNPPTAGPGRAAQAICPIQPGLDSYDVPDDTFRLPPVVGDFVNNTDWQYLGCASDKDAPKMLQGDSFQDGNTMTRESCLNYCNDKGWAYAGLTGGSQCSCGNALVKPVQNQGICGAAVVPIICTGDILNFCGGNQYTYVYNNTKTTVKVRGTPQPGQTKINFDSAVDKSPIEATYAGCYAEGSGYKALTGGMSFSNQTGMTNELCGMFCQKNKYNLFGTEFAYECYCGNTISTAPVAQSNCLTLCKGDNTQFCGNGGKLSLWTTNGTIPSSAGQTPTTSADPNAPTTNPGSSDNLDVVKPAPNKAYFKCLSAAKGEPLSGLPKIDRAGIMDVDYCAAYAKKNNYAFFGLEYSKQCLVGDVILDAADTLGANSCNMNCTADANQKCGGSGAVSMYNNTAYTPRIPPSVKIPGTEITYDYKGCYVDNGGARTLGGQVPDAANKDLTTTASVDNCLAFCQSGGYTWGGITYGSQCFCNKAGIQNNAQLKPAGDLACNMPCKGNVTQNCGQSSTIQVYQIRLGLGQKIGNKRGARRVKRQF
ncbi:putative fungistatic metabolite [Cyphellophora attinorum]|uniref:Putative fungistatic metabolite n=1 Tax=Cyphellophora attinorum TaxID=1664694 RepID=A0A0N0NPC7_9EURO|nr:putative fungistatic metabolite [Phialophora attinorum]KPI42389.1 putative fungistatic metabolite [Phialophora attinorum]